MNDTEIAQAVNLAETEALKGHEYDHKTAKAHALFLGWSQAIQPVLETHDVLAVETEFTFDLLNPETESPSKTFVEAGKIDGVLCHRGSGKRIVLEHKTTADSIDPESNYWPRLVMDNQPSKYILARRHAGEDVSSVLYDVVRKPAHRPSNIPILDEDGVKIVRDANGERVRTKDGKKWRQAGDTEAGYVLQTRPETPEEYHSRVLSELLSDIPAYFSHREIPRLDSDLLEYMNDAWALSQQILYFRRANLWPRNPAACTAYGTCEFFELCAGRAAVDGIRYRAKTKAHAELEIVENGKSFLTNSRLTALRKCGRYHFLRYEEPVEPVKDESDALHIGSVFHKACEIFLKSQITNN